jgi:hypothetical protein
MCLTFMFYLPSYHKWCHLLGQRFLFSLHYLFTLYTTYSLFTLLIHSLTPGIVLHNHISPTFSPMWLAVKLRIWKQISPNSHTCLQNCVVPQHERYLLSCTAVFLSLSDILDPLQTVTNCMICSTRLSVLLPQLVTTCSSI